MTMLRNALIALVGGVLMAMFSANATLAGTYRLMFDLLSPAGITCEARMPEGGNVHQSHNLMGNPVIRLIGDVRNAEILCTLPDGSRWQALAQRRVSPASWPVDAVVAARIGAKSTVTIHSIGRHSTVIHNSFQRID